MIATKHYSVRPRHFAEIVGNQELVSRVTRAVSSAAPPNLYLFSGPTGAGKTTIARLVAQRLLCVNASIGAVEPCGECGPCAIRVLNDHFYFEEVDAADPETEGRFSMWSLHDPRFVYFIDEAQELPRRAMVRLRKMVDDHQASVILATTDTEQLDDALLNRLKTFHYELRRPQFDEIADFLEQKAQRMGVRVDNRDQLIRVAEHYNCEMRPCAAFIGKLLAECTNAEVTDSYLDTVLGPSRKGIATRSPRLL